MRLRDSHNVNEMARRSVEMRLQMLHYTQTDGYQKYIQAFLGTILDYDVRHLTSSDKEAIALVADSARLAWKEGQSSILAPAMTSVVAAAANALDMSDMILTWEDMPDQGGVILLPQPIYLQTIAGKRIGLSAITWTPAVTYVDTQAKSGIVVLGYSDPDDLDDDDMRALADASWKLPRLAQVRGPLMPAYLQLVELYREVGHLTLGDPGLIQETEDQVWSTDATNKVLVRDQPGQVSLLIRLMYAFWRISEQRIAVSAHPDIPKSTQKRALRASLVHNTRVVMLRSQTVKREADGEAKWHYSVRFIVTGHWRKLHNKQGKPYKTWVHQHIKGPPDAPLLLGEKVKVLAR